MNISIAQSSDVLCPDCDGDLKKVNVYKCNDIMYCPYCDDYKVFDQESSEFRSHPRCKGCRDDMFYIPEHNRWYCYDCERYGGTQHKRTGDPHRKKSRRRRNVINIDDLEDYKNDLLSYKKFQYKFGLVLVSLWLMIVFSLIILLMTESPTFFLILILSVALYLLTRLWKYHSIPTCPHCKESMDRYKNAQVELYKGGYWTSIICVEPMDRFAKGKFEAYKGYTGKGAYTKSLFYVCENCETYFKYHYSVTFEGGSAGGGH